MQLCYLFHTEIKKKHLLCVKNTQKICRVEIFFVILHRKILNI